MKEIWKDVEGYNGKYQVSNLGNVRTNNYRNKGIKRQVAYTKAPQGYLSVSLSGKSQFIHRLVAQAFIPNPQNLPCVNHIDEVKDNNCVDNLEWCDYRYNLLYNGHNANKKIVAITADGQVEHYKSRKEACELLGLSHTQLGRALHGEVKTYRGRKWLYDL